MGLDSDKTSKVFFVLRIIIMDLYSAFRSRDTEALELQRRCLRNNCTSVYCGAKWRYQRLADNQYTSKN